MEKLSMERQVKLTGGALIALFLVLGHFMHPWFNGLAFLAALGMIYAGLSGNCLMTKMLEKAPWNKA